jgi:hypothetical protein
VRLIREPDESKHNCAPIPGSFLRAALRHSSLRLASRPCGPEIASDGGRGITEGERRKAERPFRTKQPPRPQAGFREVSSCCRSKYTRHRKHEPHFRERHEALAKPVAHSRTRGAVRQSVSQRSGPWRVLVSCVVAGLPGSHPGLAETDAASGHRSSPGVAPTTSEGGSPRFLAVPNASFSRAVDVARTFC